MKKLLIIFFVIMKSLTMSAKASDNSEKAEYIRISDTMMRLSKRKLWSGVAKRFSDLENLNQPIRFEHLLVGAQAAQEMGDMALVRSRLRRANKLKKKRHIIDWLNDIEENYGSVTLESRSRQKQLLQVSDWPIDPVMVNAIKNAQKELDSNLKYKGLLPVGKYTFVDHEFQLQSGVDIQLNINPRQRKRGLKKPLITVPELNYETEN